MYVCSMPFRVEVLDGAPPITDKRWKVWSTPLLSFLSKPRGWPELNRWNRENRLGASKLRQCLAWLEESGLCVAKLVDGEYLWVVSSYREPFVLPKRGDDALRAPVALGPGAQDLSVYGPLEEPI